PKEIPEEVSKIRSAETCTAKTTKVASRRHVSHIPELIVLSPFLWIAEDFVCLVYLFIFFLCLCVSRICIRMILPGQLTVRLFDLVGRGSPPNTQYFIIVFFAGSSHQRLTSRYLLSSSW